MPFSRDHRGEGVGAKKAYFDKVIEWRRCPFVADIVEKVGCCDG
jgi:hypothetical protein